MLPWPFFNVHFGYSLSDIVLVQLSRFCGEGGGREIPLPGSGMLVKNQSARSKFTTRSKVGVIQGKA